jgi:hypothetical protein
VDLTICEGMSGEEKGSNIRKDQCKLEEVVWIISIELDGMLVV